MYYVVLSVFSLSSSWCFFSWSWVICSILTLLFSLWSWRREERKEARVVRGKEEKVVVRKKEGWGFFLFMGKEMSQLKSLV